MNVAHADVDRWRATLTEIEDIETRVIDWPSQYGASRWRYIPGRPIDEHAWLRHGLVAEVPE